MGVAKKSIKKLGVGAIFDANLSLICDVRRVKDEDVMTYMNICRATYYDRKKHPEKWTASNMDAAARLFKVSVTDMVSHMMTPEEVA